MDFKMKEFEELRFDDTRVEQLDNRYRGDSDYSDGFVSVLELVWRLLVVVGESDEVNFRNRFLLVYTSLAEFVLSFCCSIDCSLVEAALR